MCMLYVHKAHLFCTQILYLSDYLYVQCIGNTYVAYCVCGVYIPSAFAIHYKYIVEVLGKP